MDEQHQGRAKRGSSSPLLDAKIGAPSAPKLTSPDGAADPPDALRAFLSSIQDLASSIASYFGASAAADRTGAVVCESTSGVPSGCSVARRPDRAIGRARCVSRRPSPFAQLAWQSSGLPFLSRQSVLLPVRRHTDLGIAPDRFSAPPQTPAPLP